jgi:hypothetical protein
MGPAQLAANDLDLGGRAEGARARKTEEVCPQGDLLAVSYALGGPVERGKADVSGGGAGQHERGGDRSEPRGTQTGEQTRDNSGNEEHQARWGLGERETCATGGERNVEGPARNEGERGSAWRGGVRRGEWAHERPAPARTRA